MTTEVCFLCVLPSNTVISVVSDLCAYLIERSHIIDGNNGQAYKTLNPSCVKCCFPFTGNTTSKNAHNCFSILSLIIIVCNLII